MMAPGSRLLALASQWFDEHTVARVFQPLVADLQHEWSAAGTRLRPWIASRGRIAFAVAFLASSPRVLATPAPSWLAWRVLAQIAVFSLPVVIVGGAMRWQTLSAQLPGTAATSALGAAVILLPLVFALTVIMAIAIGVAVDVVRGSEDLTPAVQRAVTTRLLIAITIWTVVGGGWIVPAVNQAWRTSMMAAAGAPPNYAPPRGVQELTTVELIFHADRSDVQNGRAQTVATRELTDRISLILLPFFVAALRWRTPSRPWTGPRLQLNVWTGLVIFLILAQASGPIEDALGLAEGGGALVMWLLLTGFVFVQSWRPGRLGPHGAEPQEL
jgi:hypothetical protein